MERIKIWVRSIWSGHAVVQAISEREVRGLPQCVIQLWLELPMGATNDDALKCALQYLDIARCECSVSVAKKSS
jgi:hypothetical protein